ncbi:MAG: hypothetical protein LAT67_12080 [Balneolales bacterium]|nr:hypothetical protein [Balneolales bacterium]
MNIIPLTPLFTRCITGSITLIFLMVAATSASAQQTGAELASAIERSVERQLSDINTVSIRSELSIFSFETETVYEKITKNGRSVLVPIDEDSDSDFLGMMPFASYQMLESIRNADSVRETRHNGQHVIEVIVSDIPDSDEFFENEEMEGEIEFTSGRMLLERETYNPVLMEFEGENHAGAMLTVVITLEDYQSFSGLMIPMVTNMQMKGMDSMYSEAEIREARESYEQMKQQLSELPEAQREMILSQMAPQIEQFEQMIASGDSPLITHKVLEVVVNQH